ncbi:hypothetical protein JNUCC83_08100 [Vagococcus sp. JNUCC 83]
MKKTHYLYIILGIYCILLLISGKVWFMVAYLFLLSIAKYYSVKRNKDLNYMWYLVERKGLSLSELSELSGIGKLDLKATQSDESGRYIPPPKVVKQIIINLENYSE